MTCSPDVASSTNLGGWINKTGVWSVAERPRLVRRRRRAGAAVVESRRAGSTSSSASPRSTWWACWANSARPGRRWGERLIPIATLYDPFVARALEPWSFGIYAGGQSILVGTPSGVTLAPEGGAHQSDHHAVDRAGAARLRGLGAGVRRRPGVVLPEAMSHVGVPGGTSSYVRLSTRPIDPAVAQVPSDPAGRERRRRQAVAGGYRLPGPDPADEDVTLVGVGALMPEVVAAAAALGEQGVAAGVVCLTSPDLVFRSFQQRGARTPGSAPGSLDLLFPPQRPTPLVTVLDGHPHTLSFLAGRARGPDPLPGRDGLRPVLEPAGRLRPARPGHRLDRGRRPGPARPLTLALARFGGQHR